MNKAKKGFTLVEIMIVVAIIAILAAVAIPNFIGYRKSSQRASCIANLKQLDNATEAWRVNQSKSATDVPTQADLFNAEGTGLLKTTVSLTCPAQAGGTYSYDSTGKIGHWKCDSFDSDTDYPHKTN